jgi:hypothetical protein
MFIVRKVPNRGMAHYTHPSHISQKREIWGTLCWVPLGLTVSPKIRRRTLVGCAFRSGARSGTYPHWGERRLAAFVDHHLFVRRFGFGG